MATWQLQTAKAKLSELLRAVREDGPQTISVRGKEEFVVTQKEGSAKTPATTQPESADTLLSLFGPVLGIGVDLELPARQVSEPRLLWWEEENKKPSSKRRKKK